MGRKERSIILPIDKVADSDKELDKVVLAEGFGGMVDIQVGPNGNLYVLSLYYGGAECVNERTKDCYYSYERQEQYSELYL